MKQLIALLLAAVMLLGMASCSTAPNVIDSDKAWEHHDKGFDLLQKDQYTQAIEELKLALRYDNTVPYFYTSLIVCYLNTENYQAAVDLVNDAPAQVKQDKDVKEMLAVAQDMLAHVPNNPDAKPSTTPADTEPKEYRFTIRSQEDLDELPTGKYREGIVHIAIERMGDEIDLTPLTLLPNLRSLNLSGTTIPTEEHLKVLVHCKKLETLNLGYSENLTTVSMLADMPALKELNLDNCTNFTDFDSISRLKNLTYLCLASIGVKDLSFLSGMTGLTKLDLRWSELEGASLEPLGNLTKLEWLDIFESGLDEETDLTPLAKLTNLTYLGLAMNRHLADVSCLAPLTNLTDLDLRSNSIEDLSFLSGMTKMEYLLLNANEIKDVSALAGLTKLTHLSLAANLWIEDISALAGLTELIQLRLDNIFYKLTDFSALSGMTKLTYLDLTDTEFSDTSVLTGMTQLTELVLSETKITDVGPLLALTALEELEMNQCDNLTDITPLLGMNWLKRIKVFGKNIPAEQITRVKEMVENNND